MAFRITNAISEDDYKEIANELSDKKAIERDARIMHFDNDGIGIRLIRINELELPLSNIGERFSNGDISSQDAETYEICIRVMYESRENNFGSVVELFRGRTLQGYTMSFGKKTIDFYRNGVGYRASAVGRDLDIKTVRERKIDVDSIKEDIESVLSITEAVINGVYEVENVDLELELRARVGSYGRRFKSGKKNDMEKAIKFEKPDLTFQDIGGCSEAKSELTLLGHGLVKPESFEKWGLSYPRGILLHGAPGTGKTLLAKAMANLANASLYCVSVTDVLTCWYGESPKLIGKVFDVAQKNAPSIILFDEIDSLARNRADADEETVRVISVFLQKMDGMKGMDKVTVIGTTNFMENIDPAMLRPGRFDKIVEVPLPDKDSRAQIFRIHAKGKRISPDIDYDKLAANTEGFTGADIAETLQIGLGRKLREELDTGNADLPPLDTEDVLQSIADYKRRRDSRSKGLLPESSGMYA
jgi:transitional endoplasmic reticulum ATPase